MDALTLNINEYSDNELEEILSLTYPYNRNDIAIKKKELYKKLISDSSVTVETKTQISSFLDTVYLRLCDITNNDNNLSFNTMKNPVKEVNSHFIIQKEAELKEAFNSRPSDG